MQQNYKRIAKNTIFLYFRMIIIMAVSFYTIRVVLDTLGITDFGLYELVASFVAIMVFLNGTLTSGTQRFLTFEIGKNNLVKLKQTFSIAILIHISLALFILIVGETIGLWFLYEKMNIPADRFDAAFWAYQFAIFSTMITIMQVPYNALIIAHERMHIFAYISILEAGLKLLIVYLLLLSSYDKLISYAILIFLVSISIAFIYRTYVIKNYQESYFEFSFDKDIVKSMVHFSGWNIFGTLGSLLSTQGINIILNIFFGPIAVAARAISMQVSGGLSQFVNGFQQAVTPQITKLYASNQIEEMNKLLYQNSKYAFLLLWLIAFPVIMQTEYILNLWLVEVPKNTVIFCQIIIAHSLIMSLNRPYVMAIHATGNMKQTNVTAGTLLILVLPISYLLLDNGFSIITPLIIYMIATLLCFIIELYYLKKWINVSVISLFKNTLFPVSIISIISIIPVYLIINLYENSFIKFLFVTFFSMFIVFALSYLIALDKEEKAKLKTMIKNKIKR
ncbi:oligosaccharide flippase family protein [Aliarcobacter butzleri]|uniref:oligosaccharide flippase family protein n=1 Tax=Aliarcobacter butzleri TaxID=28197 RepID=UPI002B252DD9|nr:oligosaccharide flippase family protein [Aliarcobacter butzleri]